MKKILFIVLALFLNATLTFAQDAKAKSKPVGTVQPKQVPLKAVSNSKAVSKQEPAEAAAQTRRYFAQDSCALLHAGRIHV